jgi:2-methylcitrate dehydratase PrpD
MANSSNALATVPDGMKTTAAATAFVEDVGPADIPGEAMLIGTRCLLDGLGLFVAGSEEHSVGILIEEAERTGGRPEALLLGRGDKKVPVPMAARVLGTAGHAHDWDDSQVSFDPAHVYGLLTHPTIPPLTSALVTAQKLGAVDGRAFMLAFLTGFEVECKISEWMSPQHYMRGMHSSGTVGTFGAYAAAAKLLGLKGEKLRSGFGIAASFAAGIRCNFGTMTKPLHRPGRGKRRHRGASRRARLYGGPGCSRRPLGLLRRARGRRQRGEDLTGLWRDMEHRRAGGIHQALSMRRADPSDHRPYAEARERA